jgi:hypothetical protein
MLIWPSLLTMNHDLLQFDTDFASHIHVSAHERRAA